jgi:UDP-N-acetylglucosamine 2-epimerase (non-hydrolysing)
LNYFGKYFDVKKKLVLITGHRRESFGDKFIEFCDAIKTLATKYPDYNWIYPVHLNPNVQEPVRKHLSGLSNVILMEPLDYPNLLWLLKQSEFVLTDSGGIQEEAPSLGKPVLVTRDVTERQEGIDAGTAVLVGTNYNKIVQLASNLIDDSALYNKMANAVNPYGDGTSSAQIIEVLSKHL